MSRRDDFAGGADPNPWGVGQQRFKTAGAAKGWLTKYESTAPDADMWEHEVVDHPSGEGFAVRTRKSQKHLDFEADYVPFWKK